MSKRELTFWMIPIFILGAICLIVSVSKLITEIKNYSYEEEKSSEIAYEETIDIDIEEIAIEITKRPTPVPTQSVQTEITLTDEIEIVEDIINKEESDVVSNEIITTLYDVYTEEELDLLFRVVEAEVTDGDFDSKCNVASVIFNRLNIGWWGNELESVLLCDRQFKVVSNNRYMKVEVTDSTIDACEYVFENGDTTGGALYFDSTKGNSWAHDNCEFMFSDRVGHWFYR